MHHFVVMSYLRDIMRRLAARREPAVSSSSQEALPGQASGRQRPQDGIDTTETHGLPLDVEAARQARSPHQPE